MQCLSRINCCKERCTSCMERSPKKGLFGAKNYAAINSRAIGTVQKSIFNISSSFSYLTNIWSN